MNERAKQRFNQLYRGALKIDRLLTEKFLTRVETEALPLPREICPLPSHEPSELKDFIASENGKLFKKAFRELTHQLLKFALQHNIPDARKACRMFEMMFINYEGSDEVVNEQYLGLYINGVPDLYRIIEYIKSVNNSGELCKDILANIVQGILVCGPGVYYNIASNCLLLASKVDMPNYLQACRDTLVRQHALSIVSKRMAGTLTDWEIHVVNAVCDQYIDALGMNKFDDPFVDAITNLKKTFLINIYHDCAVQFRESLHEHFNCERIIEYIADNKGINTLLDKLLQSNPSSYSNIIDKLYELLEQFGQCNFTIDDLLVRDSETGKYLGRTGKCDQLIFTHIMLSLIKSGYIEKDKYKFKQVSTKDIIHYIPNHSLNMAYVESKCALILLDTFDPKTDMPKLTLKSRTAYIITKDKKIYYMDSMTNDCRRIAGTNKSLSDSSTIADKRDIKQSEIDFGKKLEAIHNALKPRKTADEKVTEESLEKEDDYYRNYYLVFSASVEARSSTLNIDQKYAIDAIAKVSGSVPSKQPLIPYLVELFIYHPDQYQAVMSDLSLGPYEKEVIKGVHLFLRKDSLDVIEELAVNGRLKRLIHFASTNEDTQLEEVELKKKHELDNNKKRYGLLNSYIFEIEILHFSIQDSDIQITPYDHYSLINSISIMKNYYKFLQGNKSIDGIIPVTEYLRNILKTMQSNTLNPNTINMLNQKLLALDANIAKLKQDFADLDIVEANYQAPTLPNYEFSTMLSILLRAERDQFLKIYGLKSTPQILEQTLAVINESHLRGRAPETLIPYLTKLIESYLYYLRGEGKTIGYKEMQEFFKIADDNIQKLSKIALFELLTRPDFTPELVTDFFGKGNNYFEFLKSVFTPEEVQKTINSHLMTHDTVSIIHILNLEIINNIIDSHQSDGSILLKLELCKLIHLINSGKINSFDEIITFTKSTSNDLNIPAGLSNEAKEKLIHDFQEKLSNEINAISISNKSPKLTAIINGMNLSNPQEVSSFFNHYQDDLNITCVYFAEPFKSAITNEKEITDFLTGVHPSRRYYALPIILKSIGNVEHVSAIACTTDTSLANLLQLIPNQHRELCLALLPYKIIKNEQQLLEMIKTLDENKRAKAIKGLLLGNPQQKDYFENILLNSNTSLINLFGILAPENKTYLLSTLIVMKFLQPAFNKLTIDSFTILLKDLPDDYTKDILLKTIKLDPLIQTKSDIFKIVSTYSDKDSATKYIMRACAQNFLPIISSNNVEGLNISSPDILMSYLRSMPLNNRRDFIKVCPDLKENKFNITSLNQLNDVLNCLEDSTEITPADLFKIINIDALQLQNFIATLLSQEVNPTELKEKLNQFIQYQPNEALFKYVLIEMLNKYITVNDEEFAARQRRTGLFASNRPTKTLNHLAAIAFHNSLLNNTPLTAEQNQRFLPALEGRAIFSRKSNLADHYSLYQHCLQLFNRSNAVCRIPSSAASQDSNRTNAKFAVVGENDVDKSIYMRNLGQYDPTQKITTAAFNIRNRSRSVTSNFLNHMTVNSSFHEIDTDLIEGSNLPITNFDGAIITFDGSKSQSITSIEKWCNNLRRANNRDDLPIILIGTTINAAQEKEIQLLANRLKISYTPTDSMEQSSIDKAVFPLIDKACAHKFAQFRPQWSYADTRPLKFLDRFKNNDIQESRFARVLRRTGQANR